MKQSNCQNIDHQKCTVINLVQKGTYSFAFLIYRQRKNQMQFRCIIRRPNWLRVYYVPPKITACRNVYAWFSTTVLQYNVLLRTFDDCNVYFCCCKLLLMHFKQSSDPQGSILGPRTHFTPTHDRFLPSTPSSSFQNKLQLPIIHHKHPVDYNLSCTMWKRPHTHNFSPDISRDRYYNLLVICSM